MTTSDHHETAAGEFRNEEGMLGSTNLEHVRDAEVEHVLCGPDLSHVRLDGRPRVRGWGSTPTSVAGTLAAIMVGTKNGDRAQRPEW